MALFGVETGAKWRGFPIYYATYRYWKGFQATAWTAQSSSHIKRTQIGGTEKRRQEKSITEWSINTSFIIRERDPQMQVNTRLRIKM